MRELKDKTFQLEFGSHGYFYVWAEPDGTWRVGHTSAGEGSAWASVDFKTFEQACAYALNIAGQTLRTGSWS